MVQVIQPRDIGAEIGQSFGGGLGKIAELGMRQQLTSRGLEALNNLGPNATFSDAAKAIAQGAAISPAIAEMAGPFLKGFADEKKRKAYENYYLQKNRLSESGGDVQPTSEIDQTRAQPENQQVVPQRGGGGKGAMRGIEDIGSGKPILSDQEKQDIIQANWDNIDAIPGRMREAEEAKIRVWKAQTEALQQRRALEQEEAQQVLQNTQSLMDKKGLSDYPIEMDRIAYNYYDALRQQDPNATPTEIWNKVGQRMDRMVDSIAAGKKIINSPRFRKDPQRRVGAARNWIEQYKRAFGDSKEIRDQIHTLLTEGGYTDEEATRLSRPLSQDQRSAFKNVKTPKSRKNISGFGSALNLEELDPLSEEDFQKASIQFVNSMVDNWSPTTSLLNLKSHLVRDKKFTDTEAFNMMDDLIEQLGQQGINLTEEQIQEIPMLGEPIRPGLWEYFQGRGVIEQLEPLVR